MVNMLTELFAVFLNGINATAQHIVVSTQYSPSYARVQATVPALNTTTNATETVTVNIWLRVVIHNGALHAQGFSWANSLNASVRPGWQGYEDISEVFATFNGSYSLR